MDEASSLRRRLPTGVHIVALLMFLVGGIWLLAAIVLPFVGSQVAPWYIELGAAAYFLILGWGLWGGRRWAYLAALLMCVVLCFYAFRTAIVLRQNMLVPFLLLIVIFGYLIQPKVRAAFLRNRDEG
jgi:hypothetical protein